MNKYTRDALEMKCVRFEEVQTKMMMDQMMEVPIFKMSQFRKEADYDENKAPMDPNLIMDLRHRLPREKSTSSSILAVAKRLVLSEEREALQKDRERQRLEMELAKFQKDLERSRRKFKTNGTCSRKSLADSSDDTFWLSVMANSKTSYLTEKRPNEPKPEVEKPHLEPIGEIRVTIKDKPSTVDSEEESKLLLKTSFEALRSHCIRERRLRELRTKIQDRILKRRLRRLFDLWRHRVETSKSLARKKKEDKELSNERKIEIFVNAIAERQKEMERAKQKSRVETKSAIDLREDQNRSEARRKSAEVRRKVVVVESPAQNRLKAQQLIIEEQRAKLAEQNRIIEEIKLKAMCQETKRATRDTINVARGTLYNCDRKTKHSFLQLLKDEGFRDKSSTEPPVIPTPPKFLLRMEARAEARRERVKKAEETRRLKQEEQKRKEEMARREEEEQRRQLQLQAQKEAKRLRQEQEERRARELEKANKMNALVEAHYRRYLLRCYMRPFIALLEQKRNNLYLAEQHYRISLLKKTYIAWKTEYTERQKAKVELANKIYRRNLLQSAFNEWRSAANSSRRKYQVAVDFYDMNLQSRFVKIWRLTTLNLKIETYKKEQRAAEYHEQWLKKKYFGLWRYYPHIADQVEESEKLKDEWRLLVQSLIPDYAPKLNAMD